MGLGKGGSRADVVGGGRPLIHRVADAPAHSPRGRHLALRIASTEDALARKVVDDILSMKGYLVGPKRPSASSMAVQASGRSPADQADYGNGSALERLWGCPQPASDPA